MTPIIIEQLLSIAAAAKAAGHGGKAAIYADGAQRLGISVPTLHRKLKQVALRDSRKKRADAGAVELPYHEAQLISAYLMEHRRRNGKKICSIESALETLRANNEVQAAALDKATGELTLLSASTVRRALRVFNLHPDQLLRPTPKTKLASLHPNHVWEIDPSLCVMYYMPSKRGEYLQVMDADKFYKNKPQNFRKIERERVWRYVITDHTSGVIFLHYVLGAESGKNLLEAFIRATQKLHPSDPFHGIPKMVMVDPGSANTSAVFKNLCYALGIKLQVNEPGKPWAKGQVEKSNDIVECHFEHRLKTMPAPPQCVEELNEHAEKWMRFFNATRVHSRTGKPRYAVWMMIAPDQLVIAPPADTMREVAIAAPVERVVSPFLEVDYRGKSYSVADIPNIIIGEKIRITRNPWRDDCAQVIYTNNDGVEVMQIVEPTEKNQYGFDVGSPIIGESYKAKADTELDKNRKAIERIAMDAETDEEAAQKRKQKAVPFGGRIDSMAPINNTPLPDYMPKRGTELELNGPVIEQPVITVVQMAKRLRARIGSAWRPDYFAWLQQHYADGVTEDELADVEARLLRKANTSLKAV